MRLAAGSLILTLDGDLQNDPEDFPAVLARLEDHDAVFGYRAGRRDSWLRRVSSRVANRVRNLVLRDGVRDTGCGLKGFRRSVVPHLVSFNGAHRFFAVTVRMAGLTIAETAQALSVSPTTVKDDWQFARAWLLREMSRDD